MANKNVIGFSMGLVAGSTLLKVGLCQQKLGALEREFAASASQVFGDPLKKFLESDLKVILNPNLKKNRRKVYVPKNYLTEAAKFNLYLHETLLL